MSDDDDDPFGRFFPEVLLFETPLYDSLELSESNLKTLLVNELKVDGFCPWCREKRTFNRSKGAMSQAEYSNVSAATMSQVGELAFRCTRYNSHRLVYFYSINEGKIQKIGQLPSFADIAIDESKQYTRLLSSEDGAEFHKAIGLAAHGVGIGSFVYIRRIFERLTQKRFDEFKNIEGWDDQKFKNLRMTERVDFLKGHLPDFLVRNQKIYSILSLGIHELDEKTCLSFFEVLRTSTIVILEEDKKKKEELDRQKALEKAIANFANPKEKRSVKKDDAKGKRPLGGHSNG